MTTYSIEKTTSNAAAIKAEARARALVASRTLAQLLDDWDATEAAPMSPDLPTVRGWIMDELEARDPQAFDDWMTSDDFDASPRDFYRI